MTSRLWTDRSARQGCLELTDEKALELILLGRDLVPVGGRRKLISTISSEIADDRGKVEA